MYVSNSKRQFGEANQYLFVVINGQPALLTSNAAAEAIARAGRQPEDVPSFWERFVHWMNTI